MKRTRAAVRFLLCVRNNGSEDLELRKVYQAVPDRTAGREGYVRVIDESGEDYLYPTDYFVPVNLPLAVARELEGPNRMQVPANTALQPSVGARHRSRRMRLRAARGSKQPTA